MKKKNIVIRSYLLVLMLFSSGVFAVIGSGLPNDTELTILRSVELKTLDVAIPDITQTIQPVERVPRENFGVVGKFPLGINDLKGLVYPSTELQDRKAILEGLDFFTKPHTSVEGAGPVANQTSCLGCHKNTSESVNNKDLLKANCKNGSQCVSMVSRAGRSTPTNFNYTAKGIAPDNINAVTGPGKTAAFTIFSDFKSGGINGLGIQDGLNGDGYSGQQLGGFVQHLRPSILSCLPDILPSINEDINLVEGTGFRRAVSERAAPPYVGRGLIEAVPTADILKFDDSDDKSINKSELNDSSFFGCKGDCIVGHHNQIPTPKPTDSIFAFVGGVGRFGLRANGAEILQFVQGGLQGELGFTSLLNTHEVNSRINTGCGDASPGISNQVEVNLSTPFSLRNLMRLTALPEFGAELLDIIKSTDPVLKKDKNVLINKNDKVSQVQRGAILFGVDLNAFANRMIPGQMPKNGDGLDEHAINKNNSNLDCTGCHIPIQRTGMSPSTVGSKNLSYKWAPIFSDLILHAGPTIDAERFASIPRTPGVVKRPYLTNFEQSNLSDRSGALYSSFDIPRNLTDDVFTNQKATANGRDFRTAPLMGLGRIGPPFMHDARIYLSNITYNKNPASTVISNSEVTNAPLLIRTLDDAIRAAIEMHDLPMPDDVKTKNLAGWGCPVPSKNGATGVDYGAIPEDVICPPYNSTLSISNRSEAREVIRRYRSLSPKDQQALIEFLKQL